MTKIIIGGREFNMKSGINREEKEEVKLPNFPQKYKNITINDFIITEKNNLIVKMIHEYALNFKQNLNRSILLSGTVGSGKTYLAYLALKIVLEQNYKARLITITNILQDIKSTYNVAVDSEKTYIQKLCKLDLLIIDDLGVQNTNNWTYEKIYTIVNQRYETGKATIFTTNLDGKQLRASLDERIFSRILGMCKKDIYKLDCGDWRVKK